MTQTTLQAIRAELRAAIDPAKAEYLPRFFKTGPGQYAEGDQFLGVTVPAQRAIVGRHWGATTLADAEALLKSPIHEERLTALLILVRRYQKIPAERPIIYELYMRNTARINNWDLVDCSAEFIVGPYLEDRDRSILATLAASDLIWDRRIAILATFQYIRQNQYDTTLHIATLLLNDRHDLIHKAVGWMLREIGKRDRPTLVAFLATHYKSMPRTTLRYAIEHFEPNVRRAYLAGEV